MGLWPYLLVALKEQGVGWPGWDGPSYLLACSLALASSTHTDTDTAIEIIQFSLVQYTTAD